MREGCRGGSAGGLAEVSKSRLGGLGSFFFFTRAIMLRLLVKGGWPVQFSGPGGVYLDCTPKMGNLAIIWPCNSCTVSYINDEELNVGYRLSARENLSPATDDGKLLGFKQRRAAANA